MVFGRITKKFPIDSELKALLEHTEMLNPGDAIGPDKIEELTGLTRHKYPWQILVGKWREQARQRGQFFLWRQPANAWVVLTADQVVVEVNRRQNCSRRASKRDVIIASALDEEQLCPEARKLRDDIVSCANRIVSVLDTAIKQRKALLKSLEPLPRIAKTG